VHWARIFRNIFSNWTSYLVTAVVGFLLAPFVVHSLGNTGYGLWTLVLSMTGYFGLLDLGIRSSVGRFVTHYIALNDETRANRTITTAFAILAGGGVLALLATLVITVFFFGHFRVEPQYAWSGRIALLITGLNMSCILPFSVFSAVLIAVERFDIVAGVSIVGELSRAALVVWFLRHGYGLVALAVISLAITVADYSAIAVCAKAIHRQLKLRARYVDRETCRHLFGFSIYRFIWITANQVIFYSDSVVIGIFLGAAAITPYAIAGSLINYGRNFVSLMTDTLSPAATRMDAKQDPAGLQRLQIMGTKMALLIALPLCLGFLFLGRQFITLWMGKAYAGSALFLTVLTIPQFGSMSQNTSALILAGMARHKMFAYFAFAEGVANLVLSIILVRKIGLVGVAWGTAIPNLISSSVVVPLYTLRVLKMSLRDYLVQAYLRPVLSAVPIVAMGFAFSRLDAATWVRFGIEVLAMCAAFGGVSYFLCLDASQRASLSHKLSSFYQRRALVQEG
jgi:O-antigen/teichoic acid export membrane protein